MKNIAIMVSSEITRLGLEEAFSKPELDIKVVASAANANGLLHNVNKPPEILLCLTDTALAEIFQPVIALGQRFSQPPLVTLCLCQSFYHHERQKALAIGIRGILNISAALPDILAALALLPAHQVINTGIMTPGRLLDNNLTKRERQIGKLLSEGLRAKEIADEIQRSVKTVETHTSRLMRKLDIHNRAGVVRYFMRVGE